MAIRDFEAFLRERAARFDPNLDLSPGSPFDIQVIQPAVRRLGIDPFSVDLSTFLDARLRQAFPDMALDEGDAITDLLVKPNTLLWDPIVREITRVQRGLSFKDPSTLTVEEAEALGANLFAERNVGARARGATRVFFAQPQNIAVSPINYATSKGGLRFFPTEAQTIRTDEMLVNVASDGTYYFDINLIAENPGDEYNIGADELVSIANVESAVKVTNLRRFRQGEPEDSAEEFVDKAKGELTERSLVTLRGISAQLTKAFPEIRRLNVVGFNDPEMQRDVVKGGGYGAILASGNAGLVVDDGENQAASRRFGTAEASFTTLIGPSSLPPGGFVLTVIAGVDDLSAPVAQDFKVRAVRDSNTLDLLEQRLGIGRTGLTWMLRKAELTLSDIPGGILFPDGPQGTVTIPDGTVHIGGCTDIHVRGTDFDEATLVLTNISDDLIELSGAQAQPAALPALSVNGFLLADMVTGVDYSTNSEIFRLLEHAGQFGLSLQIVTGPNSTNLGVYRIVRVAQTNGQPVELQVAPVPGSVPVAPPPGTNDYHWRLFDQVNIDLVDPKETKVSGTTLVTVQSSSVVKVTPALDFNEFGVAQGDTLRILVGPDAGDYRLTANPLAPGFDKLQLDTPLKNTASNLRYLVFRANAGGGVELPLIRITKIELLDGSNQPVGTTIPYARPVDIQSRAFQNPARGVKHALVDAQLGLLSIGFAGGVIAGLSGQTVNLRVLRIDGATLTTIVGFTGSTTASAVADLNAGLGPLGFPTAAFVYTRSDGTTSVAIRPTGVGLIMEGGTALSTLFGNSEPRSTADIRSATVDALTNAWDDLNPPVDYVSGLDLAQVVDGNQVGFYGTPYSGPVSTERTLTNTGTDSRALIIRNTTVGHDETTRQFAPEEGVQLELGARSLGSARCFFLEPTSIEFSPRSFFYINTDQGRLRYLPDPTLSAQVVPPLPSNSKSNDGSATIGGFVLTAASQNFLQTGIAPGDELVIDYVPLTGTVALLDPVPGLVGKSLRFSINNGPDLTVTFIRDDVSLALTEVSRNGVAFQINAKAGLDIASITAGNFLEFEADAKITIRGDNSALSANTLLLGNVTNSSQNFITSGLNVTNVSPHAAASPYTITGVTQSTLTVAESFGPTAPFLTATLSRQGFRVRRPGQQRITTTTMASQFADAGLYYFDVELVSEGAGDLWNIDAGRQLFVDDFRADGYYLTTDDSNLAFSTLERPKLVISKSILDQGVDDSPINATLIVGRNLQITYERSQLVADVQAFVTAETERVQCESALARHLIPNFVRFSMLYVGGSTEGVMTREIIKYIRDLFPDDALESSDLQKILSDRGATSIINPIDIVGIVHQVDRKIQAARSQNALKTGRLAAFIPDLLSIKKNLV